MEFLENEENLIYGFLSHDNLMSMSNRNHKKDSIKSLLSCEISINKFFIVTLMSRASTRNHLQISLALLFFCVRVPSIKTKLKRNYQQGIYFT
jgi:hypothetical protein